MAQETGVASPATWGWWQDAVVCLLTDAASTASSLPPLPLVHPAIAGEWLRGVVSDHYCALVVGAVYRNLLLSVNTAHAYPGSHVSHGCRQDIDRVLVVEQHLVGRAQGFAVHR